MSTKQELYDIYANPVRIFAAVLADVEEAGGGIVPTAKSGVSVLSEKMSLLSSGMMNDMLNHLTAENPNRAQHISELYKHMSDYDHVGIYATPSTTKIEVICLLDELLTDGLAYTSSSDRIVAFFEDRNIDQTNLVHCIPAHSQFTIGGYVYSNRYPVRIEVVPASENSSGRIASVSYDNFEEDEAHPLQDYHVEYRLDEDASGSGNLVSMFIDVEQYELSVSYANLNTAAQYTDTFSFTDSLYQVRVFTDRTYEDSDQPTKTIEQTVWTELHQVMESNAHDPSSDEVPSAIVQPMISSSNVVIKIPQVYFTNDTLGTRLRVELYTTSGPVNFILPDADSQLLTGEFSTLGGEADMANLVLRQSSTITVMATEDAVVGGTGTISLEDLKNRIVNYRADDSVIADPGELATYLNSKGFDYKRFQDGLTDRIYLCYTELTDTLGRPIASGSLESWMTGDDLAEMETVAAFTSPNVSYMIPPGTVFEYDSELGISKPISTEDLGSDTLEVVETLNAGTYTTPMFHTHLMERGGSYLAYSYDFFNAFCDKSGVKEFHATSDQVFIDSMSMYYEPVYMNNDGTTEIDRTKGGWNLRLYVGSTADIQNVSVYLVIGEAVFASGKIDIDTDSVGKSAIVDLKFVTNFNLNESGKMQIDLVSAYPYYGTATPIVLESEPTYSWTDINHDNLESTSSTIKVISNADLLEASGTHPFGTYYVTMEFGRRLSQIFNLLDVYATTQEYETHLTNVVATFSHPTYAIGEDLYVAYTGTTKTWVQRDSDYNLIRKNNSGDIIYDVANPISTTYVPGMFDENGSVGPLAKRVIEYNDSIHVDAVLPDFPIVRRNEAGVATHVLDIRNDITGLEEDDVVEYVLPKYKHRVGDLVRDETGSLIKTKDRQFTFKVSIPQVELKEVPTLVTDLVDDSMSTVAESLKTARNQMLAWCTEVQSVESRLLPNTDAYFVPKKTVGTIAQDGQRVPINLSLKFTVYLKSLAMLTDSNTYEIKEAITTLVYAALTESIFSQTKIADAVCDLYPTTIDSIDAQGINGDTGTQTISRTDEEISFGIASRLSVNENGIFKYKQIEVDFKTLT